MIIDGRAIARDIINRLKREASPKKFLALVVVGGNAETESFVREKEKTAKALGIDLRKYSFPLEITQDELRREVLKIAQHKTCGGTVVQLPLPGQINAQYVLNAVPREKDVDVLGERALGAFYAGRNTVNPPAVETIKEILKVVGKENLGEAHAVIVGAGILVGKPTSVWMQKKAATLSVLDKNTADKTLFLKDADLIISGVGVAGIVDADKLKDSALVIDFGYDATSGKLRGDLTPPEKETGITYTPTPGGTGPILVAKLFENFFRLVQEQQ